MAGETQLRFHQHIDHNGVVCDRCGGVEFNRYPDTYIPGRTWYCCVRCRFKTCTTEREDDMASKHVRVFRRKPDQGHTATLKMVVTFDDVPDKSDLDDLLEKAKEFGGIEEATLTIHKDVVQDLR